MSQGCVHTLWLALLITAACGDRSKPTDPDQGSASVSGRVALTKTAAGVPNAIVTLIQGAEVLRAVPTDAEGSFAFHEVPPGSYTVHLTGLEFTGLSLRHVSFAPTEEQIEVAGAPVEVFFAGLGLVPARVVGEVRCNNSPVAGATVRVVGGETDASVQTSAQGEFAATGLGAGNYAVLLVGTPSPCVFETAFHAIHLRDGQATTADFIGTG